MKICNICDKEIKGWGNNPYPCCDKDDYESRCCDECNMKYVLPARCGMEVELPNGTVINPKQKETQSDEKDRIATYEEVKDAWNNISGWIVDIGKENIGFFDDYIIIDSFLNNYTIREAEQEWEWE